MTKKTRPARDEAYRIMVELAYGEIERAKLERKIIAQANDIMKQITFKRRRVSLSNGDHR